MINYTLIFNVDIIDFPCLKLEADLAIICYVKYVIVLVPVKQRLLQTFLE